MPLAVIPLAYRNDRESRGRRELSNLAFDGIELAIPVFDPPFAEFFPPDRVALVAMVIEGRRRHPDDWYVRNELHGEVLARYDDLAAVAVRPSVGPFR
ncbi:hypothetical protein [Dactylosporangium sp. CA-092794]|uniref:hypothetical protein n=1 Tax=Dactylosporangium sp. CA-092794 TaxID=3239929 RepID=UPI003D8F0823